MTIGCGTGGGGEPVGDAEGGVGVVAESSEDEAEGGTEGEPGSVGPSGDSGGDAGVSVVG